MIKVPFNNHQIKQILQCIQLQLDIANENLNAIDNICDRDFSKGRIKQAITRIVYSSFISNNAHIDDYDIEKEYYGQYYCLPKLINEEFTIFLYNNTAKPFGTKIVREKVKELGNSFFILTFDVGGLYNIKQLELISFSGTIIKDKAEIYNKEVLWLAD